MTAKRKSSNEQLEIIANNLMLLMKQHDITQRQLSEEIGISESAISKWLTMSNAPSMGTVQKMADYFKVQVSDIVENKDKEDNDSLTEDGRYLLDRLYSMTPEQQKQLRKLSDIIDQEQS